MRVLASALLAALLLFLLARFGEVGLADLADAWARLPLADYLAALLIHATVYNVRTIRYRLLLPGEHRPAYASVLAISASHNLAAYIFPARSGDASLVVYLKSQCGVPVEFGLAALVVSRILDLAMLALGLGLACTAVGLFGSGAAPEWMVPLGGLFLVVGASAVPLPFVADRVVSFLGRVGRWLGVDRLRLGRRVLDKTQEAAEALRMAGTGRRLFGAALLTLLVWVGLFSMYAVLSFGFGLPEAIGFAEATFGAGMAVLTNLLPINALAGFGTHEAGWAFGFGVLGVPKEQALAAGFSVHLVQLFNVCLLGFLGHVAMGLLANRSRRS